MTSTADAAIGRSPSQPGVAEVLSIQELIQKGAAGKVELALWRRSIAPRFVQEFDRLSFDRFEDFRSDGPATLVDAAFHRHLGRTGWAPDVCAALSVDVSLVLAAAEARARGSEYTIRLEHITDDACSLFHKDNTDFRIVTTYLGQGTQWARIENGDLGEVHTLNRFEVAMFLGELGRRGSRILHRSPPVADVSEQRLLFVVDVERAAWRARQGAE